MYLIVVYIYLGPSEKENGMARITIVPTSHIARESIRAIRETIEKEGPDCIAVELDPGRYQALQEGEGSMLEALRALGPATFLFYYVLKKMQDSLGRAVGMVPGSDMLEAVRISKEKGIGLALIDRDIADTFLRIKVIPAKEKLRLLALAFKAAVGLGISSKIKKPGKETIDLSKVPPEKVVEEAMDLLKEQFPQLHRILVEERNLYMARRILDLSKGCQSMVVVVGAGHAKGIRELLEKKQEPSISYSFTTR
jgi:pheromone shutdown-related protein TraB